MVMKLYLISLAAGLLVGVIYGILNVRSPAPPVIALIGLLGILIGEQIVPLAKGAFVRQSITTSLPRQSEMRTTSDLGESRRPQDRAG
jgi:XapX domain-containing protein